MKKYKWLSFVLFLTALLAILCFHSRFEVIDRVTPPSDMWGRNINPGITVFKKNPVTYMKEGNFNIIYGDQVDFQKAEVDEKGELLSIVPLGIQGYNPEKIVKYEGTAKQLLWTENYDLYYMDYSGQDKSRIQLAAGIIDFKLIESANVVYLAAAEKEKTVLYRLNGNKLEKLSENSFKEESKYVAGCPNGKGGVLLTSISKVSPTEYRLRLFDYQSGSNALVEKILPVSIENNYSTREGSNSINNLQVALDEEDIYVFYEIGKMSGQGMVARTYMGRLPQNQADVRELAFERLKLKNQIEQKDPFLSSVFPVGEQGDKINAVLVTPIKKSAGDKGSEMVYIAIDKGQIIEEKMASNAGRWNTHAQMVKSGNDFVASFLQVLGNSQYKVCIASTNEAYKSRVNKTTSDDIKLSVMEVIAAYMFVFFPIFINLLVTAPILLWPICVDFFEWKRLFRNPKLTFNIGVALEALIMIYSITNIYKNGESVSFMPNILKFPGAPFFYLFLTFAVAYLIVHFFRKGNEYLHPLPELGLFLLTHNTLMYFLYSVYMVRF